MVALPNFILTADMREVLGTVVSSELVESALAQAEVLLESNIPQDQFITWDGRLDRVLPVPALIDTDGQLLNADGDPLRLLAQDDGLNIRGLQWRVTVRIPAQVLPPSAAGRMRSWWLDAPADGVTTDLLDSVPAVRSPVQPVFINGVDASTMTAALALKQSISEKNVANGYAGLDSGGKIALSQMPVGAMEYKGVWNASTNSPTLADGTGTTGFMYKVGTAGTRNLGSGSIAFDVGDYVIHNGTTWERSRGTDDIASFLGLVQAAKNPDLLVTGAVTVDSNDLVTSAMVAWPDGSPGTLTITSRDANSAVLAYDITYGSPVTKTFTQPAITRNTNGAATNVPAIVVT